MNEKTLVIMQASFLLVFSWLIRSAEKYCY